MRLFSKHFIENSYEPARLPEFGLESSDEDIVCDEEVIQEAIRDSGLRAKPNILK